MVPLAALWTSCDVLHDHGHLRIAADGAGSGESARARELEHPTAEEDHLALAERHTAGHKVVAEGHHMPAAAAAAVVAAADRRPAAAAVDGKGAGRSWDGNSEAAKRWDPEHDAGVPDRATAVVAAGELEDTRWDLSADAGQDIVLDAADRMAVAGVEGAVAGCIRMG